MLYLLLFCVFFLKSKLVLLQMEQEIAVMARPLLNDPIETVPGKENVMQVFAPKDSTSTIPICSNGKLIKLPTLKVLNYRKYIQISYYYIADLGAPRDCTMPFVATRKLHWCEVEYIHPKLLKFSDIIYDSDDDIDLMDINGCHLEINEKNNPSKALKAAFDIGEN